MEKFIHSWICWASKGALHGCKIPSLGVLACTADGNGKCPSDFVLPHVDEARLRRFVHVIERILPSKGRIASSRDCSARVRDSVCVDGKRSEK